MQSPVISRLHRIKGQLQGIERMYKKEKYDCMATIQQIQAVRAALAGVASMILNDEAKRCADEGKTKELRTMVGELFRTS